MFPENPNWPFKVEELEIRQFNRKLMKWQRLVGTKDSAGYYLASWTLANGKRKFMRVHQIVWATFNGPVPEGFEIDHIDGDKGNNSIGNLRLVSHKSNMKLARERIGNWSKRKLQNHHVKLVLSMPGNANWSFWAERWGVSRQYLLNLRSKS